MASVTPSRTRAWNAASVVRKTLPARTTSGSRRTRPARRASAARHDDELVGETIDDRARDPIAFDSGREDRRREIAEAAIVEAAGVVGVRHLVGPTQAEECGDRPLERGPRAATVLAADGGRQPGLADGPAAAPVARDVPDTREPGPPAVDGDRGPVDALAADEGDPPGSRRAAAKGRERVVEDDELVRPRRTRERGPKLPDVARVVGAGQAGDGERDAPRSGDAGDVMSHLHQVAEPTSGLVERDGLVGDRRAADGGQDVSVGGDEHHVDLGVAAVDSKHHRFAHPVTPGTTGLVTIPHRMVCSVQPGGVRRRAVSHGIAGTGRHSVGIHDRRPGSRPHGSVVDPRGQSPDALAAAVPVAGPDDQRGPVGQHGRQVRLALRVRRDHPDRRR